MIRKEQPILFKTDMVGAILGGTKTETRRTQKLSRINEKPNEWTQMVPEAGAHHFVNEEEWVTIKSPWQVGNVLWVKETHCFLDEKDCEGRKTRDYYRTEHHESNNEWFKENYKWTPSLFMRRNTARIFLEITEVSIERLQDITKAGAVAEGIKVIGIQGTEGVTTDVYANYSNKNIMDIESGVTNPVYSYKSLWESINGKGSWDLSPWVWVIKFNKIDNH